MPTMQRTRSLGWGLVLALGACTDGAAVTAPVRPGIDVLLADSLHLVRSARVGIVTNQTGVDARGVDDITRLRDAGVRLTAIFSPEHGFRGVLDEENIGHGVDSATGLPIYSLYGAVRAPTAAMLGDVEVLLIDLQDVGGRPYTFVSTALRTLRAARHAGVRVVVLDRPNPVGGHLVQGPVLDTALASWIGMLPVPLRHGMTIGELVRCGNDLLGIQGDLVVVPAAGWARERWFDATGLPWVRPSPSMPDLESATHYPGLVLFEATSVSVGRGTPIAFQVLGAPWLDAGALAAALRDVPGVRVHDTTVTPIDPPDRKYSGTTIPAVRLTVTDRRAYDPTALAAQALAHLYARYPDSLALDARRFDERAGTVRLRLQLEAGVPPDSIVSSWQPALERFTTFRRPYLLY